MASLKHFLPVFFVALFLITLALWALDDTPQIRDCGVDGHCPHAEENYPR